MNISVRNLILRSLLLVCLLAISCGVRLNKAVKPAPVEVPSGLSPEDSIAYIENSRLVAGEISVEDLLGLSEIHTLFPYYDAELTHRDSSALRQMNRFMRMQYAALGNPEDELRWVEAVNQSLADYCAEFGVEKEQALQDMMASVGHYEMGSQREMNQWCYFSSSVAYYRTLNAYSALLEDVQDPAIHKLLVEEYRAWNRLNKERHNVYVNVQRAGEHYSALPMECESQFEAYVAKRMEDLTIERSILLSGDSYMRQHPVVRSAEWNAYLKDPLWWPVDYDEESGGNEEADMVVKFKKAVEAWLDVRHAVMRALPAEQAASYDNLTADYHWAIVNETDSIR